MIVIKNTLCKICSYCHRIGRQLTQTFKGGVGTVLAWEALEEEEVLTLEVEGVMIKSSTIKFERTRSSMRIFPKLFHLW